MIETPHTGQERGHGPTVDDLNVYRDPPGLYSEHYDYYTVGSWLTRGRCAEVTVARDGAQRITVRPFLIHSYMNGITESLITEAVLAFRSEEVQATANPTPAPEASHCQG